MKGSKDAWLTDDTATGDAICDVLVSPFGRSDLNAQMLLGDLLLARPDHATQEALASLRYGGASGAALIIPRLVGKSRDERLKMVAEALEAPRQYADEYGRAPDFFTLLSFAVDTFPEEGRKIAAENFHRINLPPGPAEPPCYLSYYDYFFGKNPNPARLAADGDYSIRVWGLYHLYRLTREAGVLDELTRLLLFSPGSAATANSAGANWLGILQFFDTPTERVALSASLRRLCLEHQCMPSGVAANIASAGGRENMDFLLSAATSKMRLKTGGNIIRHALGVSGDPHVAEQIVGFLGAADADTFDEDALGAAAEVCSLSDLPALEALAQKPFVNRETLDHVILCVRMRHAQDLRSFFLAHSQAIVSSTNAQDILCEEFVRRSAESQLMELLAEDSAAPMRAEFFRTLVTLRSKGKDAPWP